MLCSQILAFECSDLSRLTWIIAGYSIKNTPSGPASGGADGSLLLNKTEAYRSEHNPMGSYYRYLLGKYTKYQSQGLGAADLIQFASSIAIASCPGGSVITTVSDMAIGELELMR